MKSYDVFRAKAIYLRNKGKTLPEICKLLSLSKTTVYYWIKGIKNEEVVKRISISLKKRLSKGHKAVIQKYALLRSASYQEGLRLYDTLKTEPFFREYVMLYATEGHRRSKNSLTVGSTSPFLLKLFVLWTKKLTRKPPRHHIFIYPDNKKGTVLDFWRKELEVDSSDVTITVKKSYMNMSRSTHRCTYGTLHVTFHDTYLKSKMDAWIDCMSKEIENFKFA